MPFEGISRETARRVTPLRVDFDDRPAMPVNVEAEQSYLGAALLNNAAYTKTADRLREEHFGTPVHGRIFAAIGKLIERGVPATAVALKNRFEGDPDLAAVGGAEYLARLYESAVTVLNVEHYADIIIDCWRRRQLIGLADDIDRRARMVDYDDPADRIAEAAGSALDALLSDSGSGVAGKASPGLQGAGIAAAEAIQRAEAAYRGDGAAGTVMSGIESFDRLTGGFQNGDLIYIGKRPSMGGTALVVTVGMNAARAGIPTAIFSAEMSRRQIGNRMLAWLTGISTRAQTMGALDPNEWAALAQAQAELTALPLLIDDTSPITPGMIKRRARQAKVRLVLVDYLQKLRPDDDKLRSFEAVNQISGALAEVAKALDVPVVCLAQISPDVDKRENKRPWLADFRGGHDAEQDAALVAMLYREHFYLSQAEPKASQHSDPLKLDKLHAEWSHALANAEGKAELVIVKARHDATGTAHCAFDPTRSLFFDDPGRQGRFW